MLTVVERYRGSMLGLAIGDALGATVESSPRGSFELVSEIVGGGPFNLRPGEWTDDTSMALCLAESLIEKKSFDPIDQLERYSKWHHEGHLSSNGVCFDIGNTVSFALREFEQSRQPFCGPFQPDTAGNGSLMRLAPVPLFFAREPEKAIFFSGQSSRTTHQAPIAIDACRYFGALILGAIRGANKNELLANRYSPILNYWRGEPLCHEIDQIAAGSFKEKTVNEIRASGYVVDSLEAALWSFYNTSSFEDGCLMAVNLGEDADTTGAIYGQLAGAFYGEKALPSKWLSKLALRAEIVNLAEQLHSCSQEQ